MVGGCAKNCCHTISQLLRTALIISRFHLICVVGLMKELLRTKMVDISLIIDMSSLGLRFLVEH